MAFTELLNAFEKEKGWVDFQIESFNKFLDFGIQNIIEEIGTVELSPELAELKLKFGKVSVGKPVIKEADGSSRSILPNEARIRNLTYSAPSERGP